MEKDSANDLYIYLQTELERFRDEMNDTEYRFLYSKLISKIDRQVKHALGEAMNEISDFRSIVESISNSQKTDQEPE